MNKVTVGVVVPYYNDSKYILSCLNSIDNQTVDFKINVYLIDDNSDDSKKLESILNNNYFNNIHISYYRSPISIGGGGARNLGIEKCEDVYLAFLDADDIWMENKLLDQIENYKSGTILTSSVLKGSSIDSSTIMPSIPKKIDRLISDSLFIDNCLIQTSTFFMETKLAKSVMFNQSLPRHQDYDFLLRAESIGYPIIQTKEATSFWRVEDASSNRFLKKKATPEFFIEWFLEYRKYMSEQAQLSYVSKNILSSCLITKKFRLFTSFYFSDSFSLKDRAGILKTAIHWRFRKIFHGK